MSATSSGALSLPDWARRQGGAARPGYDREIVVAGTGGGAGTTTVAALLFSALSADPAGAPTLLDHSGGDLGRRLAEGDEAARVDRSLALHDLGAHAMDAGLERLADPSVLLVVVTGATPGGVRLAADLVASIGERRGPAGLWRTSVVCSGAFGRHRIRKPVDQLRRRLGWRRVMIVPPDPSLAAGGRIPLSRLSTRTRRGVAELAEVLRSRRAD